LCSSSLADPLAGAARTGISLSRLIGTSATTVAGRLVQALLEFAGRGAVRHARASALKPICEVAVSVWHTSAVSGIVNPSVPITDIRPIEMVVTDEVVIDINVVASPTTTPSPAAPAAAPDGANRHTNAE
jgi:hypothetical protein